LTGLFAYKHIWRPPVVNETLGVVTYNEMGRKHFGKDFPYEFFDKYYTGPGPLKG
jgi:hypothetical protein